MSDVYGVLGQRSNLDPAPTYRYTPRAVSDGQEPCAVAVRDAVENPVGVDLVIPGVNTRHSVALVLRFGDPAALEDFVQLLGEAADLFTTVEQPERPRSIAPSAVGIARVAAARNVTRIGQQR